MIKIKKSDCSFEREILAAPFGFKGKYCNGSWQSAAFLESETGRRGLELSNYGILWSDAMVFVENGEMAGNSMMFLIMVYALYQAQGMSFETPMDLLDRLLPITYEYGKKSPEIRSYA